MKWANHIKKVLGEVQEMIDICDFAVGLSRQLARSYHALRKDLDIECTNNTIL